MAALNPIQSKYTQALLDARRRGFVIGGDSVRRLRETYREGGARLIEQYGRASSPLARARAASMLRETQDVLRLLGEDTKRIVGRSITLTAQDVTTIHRRVNVELARQFNSAAVAGMAARFDSVPVRAIVALNSRRQNARNFQTLVNRHLEDAYRDLDRIINGAVASGQSAERTAREIAKLLAGGDGDLATFGLKGADGGGVRSLLYDSRRIAVTETNNALREANTMALRASPIVQAAKWQLSGRHDGLPSSPDECDDLAAGSSPGYPPGY